MNNNTDQNQIDDWSFPDVDLDDVNSLVDEQALFTDEFNSEAATGKILNTPTRTPSPIELKEQELTALKLTFENKINLVNGLIDKIQNAAALIDEEIISILNDIIQKVAKKIITREINLNPELISKIIAELKSLVPAQQTMISVFLAPEDIENLNDENGDPLVTIEANESLSSGDVIIKNNTTEVRAVLQERIALLIEASYV